MKATRLLAQLSDSRQESKREISKIFKQYFQRNGQRGKIQRELGNDSGKDQRADMQLKNRFPPFCRYLKLESEIFFVVGSFEKEPRNFLICPMCCLRIKSHSILNHGVKESGDFSISSARQSK